MTALDLVGPHHFLGATGTGSNSSPPAGPQPGVQRSGPRYPAHRHLRHLPRGPDASFRSRRRPRHDRRCARPADASPSSGSRRARPLCDERLRRVLVSAPSACSAASGRLALDRPRSSRVVRGRSDDRPRRSRRQCHHWRWCLRRPRLRPYARRRACRPGRGRGHPARLRIRSRAAFPGRIARDGAEFDGSRGGLTQFVAEARTLRIAGG